VRARVQRREEPTPGGISGYPLDQLDEEVAAIAYHFHWPLDQIVELEHRDRRAWVDQISAINHQINQQTVDQTF
jgi:hypothetical protein